jgi:hypothetical protein
MHEGRPVTGIDGRPVRIAEPLWDRATRDALAKATAPKRDGKRAPKGLRLLTGAAFSGNCGARLHVRGAVPRQVRVPVHRADTRNPCVDGLQARPVHDDAGSGRGMVPHGIPAARGNHGAEGASGTEAGHAHNAHRPTAR